MGIGKRVENGGIYPLFSRGVRGEKLVFSEQRGILVGMRNKRNV